MCGRYTLIDGKKVFDTYSKLHVREMTELLEGLPRYNAAPMQQMPVFAIRKGQLVVQKMQWWLVPHWSKDGKTNATTFNAKAETIDRGKLFSPYFEGSRCLVPADGFYEWKKLVVEGDSSGITKKIPEKQPMCIRMADRRPFMFAGVFSVWKNKVGVEFPTFAIITTEPNQLLAQIHNRMPVILPEQYFDVWLDRSYHDTSELKKLLVPYVENEMVTYKVSRFVSNSRNEGPECVEELD